MDFMITSIDYGICNKILHKFMRMISYFPFDPSKSRGGLVIEEDKSALTHLQAKRLENWADQQVLEQSQIDVKQENSSSSHLYGHATSEDFHGSKSAVWPTTTLTTTASSPKSCVTSFSSNLLDFSYKKSDGNKHPVPDQSSEVRLCLHFA